MKRPIRSILIATLVGALSFGVLTAPAQANNSDNATGLMGNTVTYGGSSSTPNATVFRVDTGDRPNRRDPGDVEIDRTVPHLSGAQSIVAGWVYQSGPWTVAVPPTASHRYSPINIDSFATLAALAQCTAPVPAPNSGQMIQAMQRLVSVYATYGWREWQHFAEYSYWKYVDTTGDGIPDDQEINFYTLAFYDYEWLGGCGTYLGPTYRVAQCLQAIEYYLNGPFDQNGQPMRSVEQGGTNSRVPYRELQDNTIGHYSDKLQAESAPLGEYMTDEDGPYKWTYEQLLTERVPAYAAYENCLTINPDNRKQQARTPQMTEVLSSVGRYTQPQKQYFTNILLVEFTQYPTNAALLNYLFGYLVNGQSTRYEKDSPRWGMFFPFRNGFVPVFVQTSGLDTIDVTKYYSVYCLDNDNAVEVAEVTNGRWRGPGETFTYRDAQGRKEPLNGRAANEGKGDDFYSGGNCHRGEKDGTDPTKTIDGGNDILRCGDYNSNLNMAYSYARVPYVYNTKQYVFDTAPLDFTQSPSTARTLPPTTVARTTSSTHGWIGVGTRWNLYGGLVNSYGFPLNGGNWRSCTYYPWSNETGCTYGYSVWGVTGTTIDPCPSGTFAISSTTCVVADIIPAEVQYTITTTTEPCPSCTGGTRTVTNISTSYAPAPTGYMLSGSNYVRVSGATGTLQICASGYFTGGSTCATQVATPPAGEGWEKMGSYWRKISEAPAGYLDNGQEWISATENPPPPGYTRNQRLQMYERIDTSPATQGWRDTGSGWTRVAANNILVQGANGMWKPAAPIDNGYFTGNNAARWIDDPSQDDPAFQIWQVPATGDTSWVRWTAPKIEVTKTGANVKSLPESADLRWRVKLEMDPASSPMYTNNPNREEDAVYNVFFDGMPDTPNNHTAFTNRKWTPNAFATGSTKFNAWSPLLPAHMDEATRALFLRWYTSTLAGAQGWKITPWWEATVTVEVEEDAIIAGSTMTQYGTFLPAQTTGKQTVQKRVSYDCPGQPFIANITRTVT